MPEFKLCFNTRGSGYVYVSANTLAEAIKKEASGNHFLDYELNDDMEWEFDEEFTTLENEEN